MTFRWPSARAWISAAVCFALTAATVAAFARREIFELLPERSGKLTARFASGVADIEIDPRQPWARIPGTLPGPDDAWAGTRAHGIRFPIPGRPARPLVLYVRYAPGTWGETPPRLTVSVNDASVGAITPQPGRRSKTEVPTAALGDGRDVSLVIRNDSGSSVGLESIRLVEVRPTFAWSHLGRRGRFPPESAAFLVLGLGCLVLRQLGTPALSAFLRALRATAPALALVLLGLALVLPGEALLAARIPRWLWLALPWLVLAVDLLARPRHAGAAEPDADAPAPARTLLRGARTLLVNAAVSLATLILGLVVAEFVLRAVFRDVRSAADARTYFHRDVAPSPVNSFGFSEREFHLRKPAHVYRIAVIGDSFTLAAGVPVPDRFSNRLERHLNANRTGGRVYEVLNFGRVGADTEHEVRLLRNLVLKTDPDFVLLQWYINDFENGVHDERPRPMRLVPSARLHVRLLKASALYSLLDPEWTALQETVGLIETHAGYHLRRFGDPEGPDSVYAMERLDELITECKQRRVGVGIVLFPAVDRHLVEGRYPYGFLHDRVLEACREHGITCVDLRETFAGYRDYKQLWVTPLDGHPSSLAHRLAAERLAEAFGRTWLEAPLRARGGRKT